MTVQSHCVGLVLASAGMPAISGGERPSGRSLRVCCGRELKTPTPTVDTTASRPTAAAHDTHPATMTVRLRRLTEIRRPAAVGGDGERAATDTVDVHEQDRDQIYDLVELARLGDRAAFRALFDHCHSRVYRMALARLRSVEDAEDVVAETFLEAWRSLPRFRWTGAPFVAWLSTIASSKVAQLQRSSARRPATPVADAASMIIADDGALPGDVATELRMEATRLLATLPDEQRTVLALRFYGGLSTDEIAEHVGKSAGAIRQIQMRALERLSYLCRKERAA